MKFITPTFSVFFFAASTFADSVRFSNVYDNSAGDMNTVACSTGPNGLITKGITTFGEVPGFPNIGGAQAVEGFNSVNCGSCWALTLNGTTVHITAIDNAGDGFVLSQAAMDTLTGGRAQELGVVNATATAAPGMCGA